MELVNGSFTSYKNPGSDKIVGWGVRVPANRCCTGDQVRAITKAGNVHKVTLSKRTSKPFIAESGELVEVFAIRVNDAE